MYRLRQLLLTLMLGSRSISDFIIRNPDVISDTNDGFPRFSNGVSVGFNIALACTLWDSNTHLAENILKSNTPLMLEEIKECLLCTSIVRVPDGILSAFDVMNLPQVSTLCQTYRKLQELLDVLMTSIIALLSDSVTLKSNVLIVPDESDDPAISTNSISVNEVSVKSDEHEKGHSKLVFASMLRKSTKSIKSSIAGLRSSKTD